MVPVNAACSAVLGLVAALAIALVGAAPAAAADGARITSYHIDYEVRRDGAIHVIERFRYDFGGREAPGPERVIGTRRAGGTTGDDYGIRNVHAASSTGAPSQVDVDRGPGRVRIRIGDPNVAVGGVQDYTLEYGIEDALSRSGEHARLAWIPAGPNWRTPIDELALTLRTPNAIIEAACSAGPVGSPHPCSDSGLRGNRVRFLQSGLRPGEALAVRVDFASSGVTVPGTPGSPVKRPTAADAGGPSDGGDGQEVEAYQVDYEVRRDGTVHVRERMRYDFGTVGHPGVDRILTTRIRRDDGRDRVYRIRGVRASSGSGAPDDVTVDTDGRLTRIRIGDPDVPVSGVQDYLLEYDVEGALDSSSGAGELAWNVTGPNPNVPVDGVTVTVTAPGGITRSRCLVGTPDRPGGPATTQRCLADAVDTGQATFAEGRLAPGEVLTIGATFRPGAVRVPDPLVEPGNPVLRTFDVRPVTIGASTGLLAMGAVPLVLAWRRRRWAPRAVADSQVIAVRRTPPPDVSPAEAGVLLRRRPDMDDTTATLLDLAARGYLRITESGYGWTLTVRRRADADLRPHEDALLSTLFEAGSSMVHLHASATVLADAGDAVARALARSVVRRWWFRSVGKARSRAFAVGAGALAGAALSLVILVGWLTVSHRFGLVAAAMVVAAGLGVAALRFGAWRSDIGTDHPAYRQVAGFRRHLGTADSDQLRFVDGEDLFGRYLPWAIVFGMADRWAEVCERLAAAGRIPSSPSWYARPQPWSYAGFASTMSSFAEAVRSSSR